MRLEVIPNDDPKQPWYADGLSFTCTQCGNCCTGGPGYVWISREEIRRLSEYLKLDPAELVKRYMRKIGSRISLKEHRNARGQYDCTFLKEIESTREVEGQTVRYTKRICEIYPVRPLQCRTWPFWDGNLATKKHWSAAGRACPGINVGKPWPVKEIERIRTAKDWPQVTPGSE